MLAPWRSPLARALHRNRSLAHTRFLQLATVRADGHPANRTVVFRGYLDDGNQLQFVTDARSDKVNHIIQHPYGEACWYFTKTREQFRLAGQLMLVGNETPDAYLQKVRQNSWQALSDSARTQFAWDAPGKLRTHEEGFSITPPDPTMPLPPFCLLLLEPERVDHLELRGNPQNRWLYLKTGEEWTVQAVNP